jgi:hypothetical protein
MATLEEKIHAELLLRSMVGKEGLPEPDHIEYGHTCIRAIWWESKLALVVDIDELGPEADSLEDLGLDPTDLGGEQRPEPEFGRGMSLDEAAELYGCDENEESDGWDEDEEPDGWNAAA